MLRLKMHPGPLRVLGSLDPGAYHGEQRVLPGAPREHLDTEDDAQGQE